MSCGLEAMVLALQLAKELVDKPWAPLDAYGITTLEYRIPDQRPPWVKAEARDKKLKEFHEMADMCLSKPRVLIGNGGLSGRDDLTYEQGGIVGSFCENCLRIDTGPPTASGASEPR